MADSGEAPEGMSEPRIIRLAAEDVVRVLLHMPLFEGVREDELRRLGERGHILAFADGQVIIPEGEEGLGFYVVLTGAVRVGRDSRAIGRIEAGGFFGEIALLEGEPRDASVAAEGGAICLGIVRSDFRSLLVRNPRLALRILDEVALRDESSRII